MTNHNPTITSSAATGSFSEDANTTGSIVDHVLTGTMNFTDSDHSDTHTTTTALKTAVWSGGSTLPSGALTKFQAGLTSSIVSDSNGSGKLKWTFSEDDRDFDFLAKGETLVLTYEITLKDNHGGSTKQTVKLTVTGTDDRPVFATSTGATLSEQANHSLSLSPDTAHIALQFTDVDLNNTGHTASVLSVSATGNTSGILPGSFGTAELMSFFDIDNVVKTAGSSNGVVNTTFSAPDLAFDYLAAGEQIQITYVVQVDDKKGGLSTQNVVVKVNGTNDRPVVLAFPESAHLKEDQNLSGGNLTAHGDFLFSDLDLSDTHTVSTTVTATRSGGGAVPISNADLIDAMGAVIDPDSTSQLLGEVDWNFALPNSAVDFLAEGETLTLNYHITVTDPSGASDTEEVCITVLGINKPVVTKIATVPGGTADHAGEVISYTINVANSGHSDLTGITVTDPSVSNLAPVLSGGFNSGDTNHDNKLSAGETWHYTASHMVTQNDLDTNGGGDGSIDNTVSVDTNETLPVSASSSVTVEQPSHVTLDKTGVVADGTANAPGDVINYTITVTNDGTVTLTNPGVVDSTINIATPNIDPFAPVLGSQTVLAPVYDGDYNVGDTNQNGIQDPGETFQFRTAGDDNDNGIEDPGETFVFANVGDTNRNGIQDPGETFQYYNAGDTNQNGVEDPGETFQFSINNSPNPVDANNDGFNDGDTNHDGQLNVGETWQYTFQYTLTQDDIDNRNGGGVPTVDPGLTRDNTATVNTSEGASSTDTVSIPVVQNPDFTVTKAADVASVDAAGDVIHYTVAVHNTGNMTLTDLSVTDPMVADLAYASGDTNSDGELDLGETWSYTGSYTVQQSDIDNGGVVNPALTRTNTVTADTAQTAPKTASASVDIVQNPDFTITKSADVASVDAVGDVIHYTVELHNTGNMTLTDVTVTDPLVTNLAYASGDADSDGKLDLTETWTYTGSYTVQQSDIDDNGGGDGDIDNTATADTAQTAAESASASVTLPAPAALFLDKSNNVGTHFVDSDEDGHADVGTDLIQYAFQITNTGGFVLHDVTIDDPLFGGTIYGPEVLDPGESFTFTLNHFLTADDVAALHVENTATASGLDPSNNIVSIMAHYDQLLPA